MAWQEIGRAVPAYMIAGRRLTRGRGVLIFPDPMEGVSLGRLEDRKEGAEYECMREKTAILG